MLRFFAAAYAFVGDMLLLERDAARADAGDFLNPVLALFVSAPHSLDEAVAVLFKGSGDFVKRCAGICSVFAVLQRALIKSVVYLCELRLDALSDIFEAENRFFTVVTGDENALTVFDVLIRARFERARPSSHIRNISSRGCCRCRQA